MRNCVAAQGHGGHYPRTRARQTPGPSVHLGVLPLIRKLPALLIALALLAAIPGVVVARADHATLIDVHAIYANKAKPTPTANCSNDGTSNGEVELTGWAVQGSKVAHLNVSTIPSNLSQSQVLSAMSASFNAWNGAPNISVQGNGTVTRYTANHSYDLLFGRTGGSSIAVTYTWKWSNGEIESDTVFNSRLPWAIISAGDGCNESVAAYDLANIATHEFGHTYGLGHAPDGRFETMYPYGFTGETLKRTPTANDLDGIQAIY